MGQLGEELTDEEVAAMIKQTDTTGEGTISFEAFSQLMKMSDE